MKYWQGDLQNLDRGVVAGLALCIFLLLAGMVFSGDFGNFVSPMSALIVVGGTIGATLINFSFYDIKHAWSAFCDVLITKDYHPQDRIKFLVRLAGLVRREGLLVLEQAAEEVDDKFLTTALRLSVDAQNAPDIRNILETELRASVEKASHAINVFEAMGSYAPAMGLIGTLLGLISMLGKLNDPATVGPAMSVAMVTTFYGAVLSNMLFLPVAGKLKARSEEDAIVKAITIEGVLSLGNQENAIVVEQRLQSFLPLAPAA
ncbi:MAG: motility protein A [Bdellovibrionota bacterium]